MFVDQGTPFEFHECQADGESASDNEAHGEKIERAHGLCEPRSSWRKQRLRSHSMDCLML